MSHHNHDDAQFQNQVRIKRSNLIERLLGEPPVVYDFAHHPTPGPQYIFDELGDLVEMPCLCTACHLRRRRTGIAPPRLTQPLRLTRADYDAFAKLPPRRPRKNQDEDEDEDEDPNPRRASWPEDAHSHVHPPPLPQPQPQSQPRPRPRQQPPPPPQHIYPATIATITQWLRFLSTFQWLDQSPTFLSPQSLILWLAQVWTTTQQLDHQLSPLVASVSRWLLMPLVSLLGFLLSLALYICRFLFRYLLLFYLFVPLARHCIPHGPHLVDLLVAPLLCEPMPSFLTQIEAKYGAGLCRYQLTPLSSSSLSSSSSSLSSSTSNETLAEFLERVGSHGRWDSHLALSSQVQVLGQEIRTARMGLTQIGNKWRFSVEQVQRTEQLLPILARASSLLNTQANGLIHYGHKVAATHYQITSILTYFTSHLERVADGTADAAVLQTKFVGLASQAVSSLSELIQATNEALDASVEASLGIMNVQESVTSMEKDLIADWEDACAQAKATHAKLWFFQRYFHPLTFPPKAAQAHDVQDIRHACKIAVVELLNARDALTDQQNIWAQFILYLERVPVNVNAGIGLTGLIEVMQRNLAEWELNACRAQVISDVRRGKHWSLVPKEEDFARCYRNVQIGQH